jgi:hypothetical protein
LADQIVPYYGPTVEINTIRIGLQIEGVALAYFTHLKRQKCIGDDAVDFFGGENYLPDTFYPPYNART